MSLPTCLWCEMPGTHVVAGAFLCDSHAACNTCLKRVGAEGVTCRCADTDDYVGHEELVWCSEKCRDARHPEGEG